MFEGVIVFWLLAAIGLGIWVFGFTPAPTRSMPRSEMMKAVALRSLFFAFTFGPGVLPISYVALLPAPASLILFIVVGFEGFRQGPFLLFTLCLLVVDWLVFVALYRFRLRRKWRPPEIY